MFSFDANPPYTLTKWTVGVNGQVNSIAFTRHRGCADAYIGGSFTSVHGAKARNIAEVSTRTGKVVTSFGRDANGAVQTLVGYGDHLLAGGQFTRTNGYGRNEYASLNPFSGKDDGFLRLKVSGRIRNDVAEVYNQQLNHAGDRLLVEGNFTSVGGHHRQQIAMVNLKGSQASVTGWTSPKFNDLCRPSESFYVRAAAWSPDDNTAYIATTGFHLNSWNHTFPLPGICDAAAAFPTQWKSVEDKWKEMTGCDSY